MGSSPWKLALPVLREPYTKQECLIVWHQPIVDARPGVTPTRCHVIGLTREGKWFKFAAFIREYQLALMDLVQLTQDRVNDAPVAVLVDSAGKSKVWGDSI